MLRNWLEPHVNDVPESFTSEIGGNPLVSRVLFSRGLKDISAARGFLTPDAYQPAPSLELPGLGQAVEIIRGAISLKQHIGIWGDFDVDGQTSTTILTSSLRELGGQVSYHIPIRAEESHGLSLPALERFLKQEIDLIITCDTGISAYEAAEFTREHGVPVIITDHHDLPEQLPNAEVIVNPKMLPTEHPLSTLPGVGVAFKVIEELFRETGDDQHAQDYLDLVALGIVADIALLRADTRYLLQRGLDALRHTRRKGLLAIMELTELNQSNISEEHIGFVLAPRMNAIGRLDDANRMVELLTTEDMGRARVLALELEGMNAQRKLMTDQVYQAAQSQLLSNPGLLDQPVLILSHAAWPAGVIGIVASKLVEQYHRPVILLSTPPEGLARGSARSIDGINITAAIAANEPLLKSFGGHPMAAGLAIEQEMIPKFRQSMARTVQSMGIGIQKEKDLQIDGYLALPDLSLELVDDFERLAPFGAGNPPLVFATRDLRLTGYTAVGRSGEHIQLTLEDELGHTQASIWWQGAGFPLPEVKFDLAYSARASTYRGQRGVQVEWIDYRLCEEDKISLAEKGPVEIVDLRAESDPLEQLNLIVSREKLTVWGEAGAKSTVTFSDRFSLHPSEILAIWTIPPGPAVIRQALDVVKPRKIYLFAVNPGLDAPQAFLDRLAGLVKSCINRYNGISSLNSLAVSTAQYQSTVKTGLEWLESKGHLKIISIKGDVIQMASGDNGHTGDSNQSLLRLKSLLAESAAFRRYYLTANKDRLVASGEEA